MPDHAYPDPHRLTLADLDLDSLTTDQKDAVHQHQIGLTVAVSESKALVLAHLHGNGQPALQRQEAGEFQALETQDAPVVNDRAGRLEKALLGFIALVGFDHLGDRPDGQLRRKAELLAHLGINEFLQSKLGRATLPKRDFSDELR